MNLLRFFRRNNRGEINIELPENNRTESVNGKRCHSSFKNLGHYVDEYCSSSTINGVRYFGENRTAVEKIWWAISIILSLCCGIWLIIRSYEKWDNSPVVINFAAKETPIWTLPFPAVTICPYSKIDSSVFNYIEYLKKKENGVNLTEEENRRMGYMSLLCVRDLRLQKLGGQFADERVFDFFKEVQRSFYKDILVSCKYIGYSIICEDFFYPIITEDGICYTFNLMDRSQLLSDTVVHHKNFHETKVFDDWTVESGFTKKWSRESYPRRAFAAGIPFGLEINMKGHIDVSDANCTNLIKGFKVHIAHPYSMPRVEQEHFIVPYGKLVRTGVSPIVTTTSEEVKAYNLKRRDCYLPFERRLKFFKVYTPSNCELECKADYILSECGCVPFDLPRENGTLICGPAHHYCFSHAKVNFVAGDFFKKLGYTGPLETEDVSCECLPACTSIHFDMETTQATYDWRTEYATYDWTTEYDNTTNSFVNVSDKSLEMMKLQIFFKSDHFLTSERTELYGYPEFVANIGGLLGLFVGFTALSFVEIIYYLTVRIICNIYMFGKANWSGRTS